MTVNAEQIGSEGKEEREEEERGEETDGRAGPVPTIPRHDDAGGTPFPSPPLSPPSPSHLLLCVFTCWRETRANPSEEISPPQTRIPLDFFFFFSASVISSRVMGDGDECHP